MGGTAMGQCPWRPGVGMSHGLSTRARHGNTLWGTSCGIQLWGQSLRVPMGPGLRRRGTKAARLRGRATILLLPTPTAAPGPQRMMETSWWRSWAVLGDVLGAAYSPHHVGWILPFSFFAHFYFLPKPSSCHLQPLPPPGLSRLPPTPFPSLPRFPFQMANVTAGLLDPSTLCQVAAGP